MTDTDRTDARDLAPGDRVAHYEILEKIGEGGMGQVYRARDLTLPREVALKRPRPGSTRTDPEIHRRFLREGKAMAGLSHPGIVRIHEVFEENGVPWIAMELIRGESLREALAPGEPLPWDRIIHYAEHLAEALEHAHGARLLHRDIKPGNVLLGGDGRARLVDFGLARHFAGPGDTSSMSTQSSAITGEDHRPGTVAYMSPEQALGKTLDGRTDIFSLGAVLYEMCTGRQPFSGGNQTSTFDAILNLEPVAIGRLNYGIPADFESLVRKCLSKSPEDRYQDTRDLLVDIRRLRRRSESTDHRDPPGRSGGRRRRRVIGGLVLMGLMLLGMLALAAQLADLRPRRQQVQDNVRDWHDRAMEHMREQETEEEVYEAIRLLRRAVDVDPMFAKGFAELGNAWWERYRITRDEDHRRRAETAVARALELEPGLAEGHSAKGYGLLIQGRFEEARQELLLALEIDPGLDRAWASLGQARSDLGDSGGGLEAVKRAIALRPRDFRYRIRLGTLLERRSDIPAAQMAYRKAIDLKPGSWVAWGNLGASHLRRDDFEAAIPSLLRSAEIHDSPATQSNLGTAYYYLGKLPEAVRHYRRAVDLDPGRAVFWANLGDALRESGREAEAKEAYGAAVPLAKLIEEKEPGRPRAHARLGLYCARAGNRPCALTEAGHLAAVEDLDADSSLSAAVIYCLSGRIQEALDSLERAARRGIGRARIEKDPDLSRLQGEPRWARILQLAG